jgi:hypothetical protein
MSRKVHVRVIAQLDGAGAPGVGTVTIDRDAGLFEVRRLRNRRVFTLPLATVATMVCQRIVFAELREKRATKKKRRVSRRQP